MAVITLKGQPINTVGTLPAVGSTIPDFLLTKSDLSDVGKHDFSGKRLVFNIFLSLDTSVCSASVRRFNEAAAKLDNTVVLCISQDLPFAQGRFCSAEGINNVVTLSAFRSKSFGQQFGVTIIDGNHAGLFSRSVVVTNVGGVVLYTEQVPEITQEPDYEKALAALK
ncbi:MAG: thiol peroxidase [Chitinispirillaceae bacterium]|nr:thiol peroxidase [Chitinispirillaceae bacterium]